MSEETGVLITEEMIDRQRAEKMGIGIDGAANKMGIGRDEGANLEGERKKRDSELVSDNEEVGKEKSRDQDRVEVGGKDDELLSEEASAKERELARGPGSGVQRESGDGIEASEDSNVIVNPSCQTQSLVIVPSCQIKSPVSVLPSQSPVSVLPSQSPVSVLPVSVLPSQSQIAVPEKYAIANSALEADDDGIGDLSAIQELLAKYPLLIKEEHKVKDAVERKACFKCNKMGHGYKDCRTTSSHINFFESRSDSWPPQMEVWTPSDQQVPFSLLNPTVPEFTPLMKPSNLNPYRPFNIPETGQIMLHAPKFDQMENLPIKDIWDQIFFASAVDAPKISDVHKINQIGQDLRSLS